MLDLEYVFVGIGMSNGYYFKKTASIKYINRAKNINNKTSLTFKNRKKQLRYIRKEHHDAKREKEFGKITFFICFFFSKKKNSWILKYFKIILVQALDVILKCDYFKIGKLLMNGLYDTWF